MIVRQGNKIQTEERTEISESELVRVTFHTDNGITSTAMSQECPGGTQRNATKRKVLVYTYTSTESVHMLFPVVCCSGCFTWCEMETGATDVTDEPPVFPHFTCVECGGLTHAVDGNLSRG